ncbi:hypothetical protein E1289_14375 [Actinomadura sp. 6K520]|nr:hypothetical protein E1289_14375 [Actinomadura sp. 6K520]
MSASPGPVSGGSRDVPIRQLLGDDVLDVLLERSKDEAGQLRLTGEGSILGQLVKAVLERALEGELTAHLGYGKHDQSGNNSGSSRNGRGQGQDGADRGRFGPPVGAPRPGGHVRAGVGAQAGGPGRRRTGRHDHQPVHARHELARHPAPPGAGLRHELSHEQVSRITDQVMDEVKVWQTRPMETAPSTPSSSWTPWWSRCATTMSSPTSPPTPRSGSTPTGKNTCWGSGSRGPRRSRPPPPRGPGSGGR